DDVKGDIVEPVQRIKLGVLPSACLLIDPVPALRQQLEVVVNVLLKLADGLGTERVRDRLALAGMLGAISRVEEASLDGDKGVV
nr:hypothetical protein [Tanacetum cinerariifolium]